MTRAVQAGPTFMQVFRALQQHGPASIRSSRGTPYEVRALVDRRGRLIIVGFLKHGQVRIHEDCWGEEITCQGTRAGGILNGSPSIYDWYYSHC